MQSGFFWKNWSSPYREIYVTLLLILAVALVGILYLNVWGTDGLIGWSIIGQLEPVKILLETIKTGPFTLQTEADSQAFTQMYIGNYPEVQVWSYYLFLLLTVLSFNILLAVTSQLSRFWYFVGISLFVVVLVNYKLELLLLFGSDTKIGLIIALALYLPASYIFNAVKTNVSFVVRLLTFLGISGIMALLIMFFAQAPSPFLYLASYGVLNPLVVSIVFILLVSSEIIASFIRLLTRSTTSIGGRNLQHFTIITVIYLANLTLAYLHETHVIDWDILYVNLVLLLGVSTIVGIWGYASREPQYETFFSFQPVGAFFYMALAICCFATIGHFMLTANDPALEVFNDIIIYSHLGYGVIFTVYIAANFLDPLKRNMQVYKVLYKPMSMPYFTFRLAGLIAFIALLVKSNWEVPVNQSMSAYYNGLGDLHRYNNNMLLAKHFYSEGAIFGYNNHKSHFELASLAHSERKADDAIDHYKTAITKNPTPQSYVNLSNIYADRDQFFEALFTLQDAREDFPENGEILNNLGLMYAKIDILDTAAIYIDQAAKIRDTKTTASSNILSLLAMNDIPMHPDSVMNEYDIKKDLVTTNNMLILKNKLHIPTEEGFTDTDSTLSMLQSSVLYNLALNHLFKEDSIDTNVLFQYGNVPTNAEYQQSLEFAAALNLEKNHDVSKAFRQLNWLANVHLGESSKYFNLLGMWAMKYNAPYHAAEFYNYALERGYEEAKLNLAIALTEAQEMDKARSIWNELLMAKDRNVQIIANELLTILSLHQDELENDQQQYYYLRYKTNYLDTLVFEQVVNSMVDDNYKAQAVFDMVKKLWKMDYESSAIKYYGLLEDLKITDQELFNDIQWFELKMLAAQGNVRGLATKINQGFTFDQAHAIEKHYYRGLISEASGDTTNAKNEYQLIAFKNPFFEESIIASANFLGQKNPFKGYKILLNALEVNARSVKLLKAYILQCARTESTSYAEISLQTLKELVTAEDYKKFKNAYDKLLAEVQQEAENF